MGELLQILLSLSTILIIGVGSGSCLAAVFLAAGGYRHFSQRMSAIRFVLSTCVAALASIVLNTAWLWSDEASRTIVIAVGVVTGLMWLRLAFELRSSVRGSIYIMVAKVWFVQGVSVALFFWMGAASLNTYDSLEPALFAIVSGMVAINAVVLRLGTFYLPRRNSEQLRWADRPKGFVLDLFSVRAVVVVAILLCLQGAVRFQNESRVALNDFEIIFPVLMVVYLSLILIVRKSGFYKIIGLLLLLAGLGVQMFYLARPFAVMAKSAVIEPFVEQARSRNTKPIILRQLHKMGHPQVDQALAQNPLTPDDVVVDLRYNSDNPKVGYLASSHPSMARLMEERWREGDQFVMSAGIERTGHAMGLPDGQQTFKVVLPRGLKLQLNHDQQRPHGDFKVVPLEYEIRERQFVPTRIRSHSQYQGYYFIFGQDDIKKSIIVGYEPL